MANEVEVKITASTEALSQGMNQATDKVQAAAVDINRIADTIKNAFDGVRDSLKNIDISLNIDMSDMQQRLNSAVDTIRTRINGIADDAKVKLKLDTTSLSSELGQAESLIQTRLASLPIQNIRLDIDTHEIQQKFNQLGAQIIKVKPKLDNPSLTTEIALIKNRLNAAFAAGIKVKVIPSLLQADISNLKTKLQGLTNKTYKVKLGIDLTYLNHQINLARSMLSNLSTGLAINIDATSNLLRASLDRVKVALDLLRHQLSTGSGGGGGGPSGGGSGPSGGGGILTSFAGNFLANMTSQIISQLGALTAEVVRNAREIENMSRLANATTQEFQEWAFASSSVGVSQEKLGDIMKDVNDKFGDFMQTGGGEMADFFEKIAPKVGVTAKEFQGLSGPQILEKYYQTLQKANVSQAEMTFYMESIANDATLLAPLLANNGEKLKEMSKQAHELGVILDDEAIQATKEFQGALGLIGSTIKGVVANLVADLAPGLKTMANNFLRYMSESKDSIDDAVGAIITIFSSLSEIVESTVGVIGDIWTDLTQDIGDGSLQQITFMDLVSGAIKGFAAAAVGLKVGIQSAFAIIRAVIVAVCQAISIAFTGVLNGFGALKETIQFGLDYLGTKFRTFGNIVSRILSFDFSGAKAAYEQGFRDLSDITDRYSSKMSTRMDWLKSDWNSGVTKSVDAGVNAWNKIGQVTEDGNKQFTNLFLKKPTEVKPPAPIKPPPNTFNSNKGIGTGTKDDDKKASDKAKSDSEKAVSNRLIGISGNTGIGTGAHLDVRYSGRNAPVSAEHLARLQAGGKPLSAYKMTSGYGPREAPTAGASTFHKGMDFSMPVGTPITTNHSVKNVQTFNSGKGGYVSKVTFADGVVLSLLHQSPDVMNKVSKGATAGSANKSKTGGENDDYFKFQEEQNRQAEQAEKERLELKYKYATEQEKVEQDLARAIQRINDSTASTDDKKAYRVKAEQEAQAQMVEINLRALEQKQAIDEQEIQFKLDTAQRIFEIEKSNIQAAFDAGRISNVEKLKLEKQLEDQMYLIKREGLLKRLDLEAEKANLTGKDSGVASANNAIVDLDHQKTISDIQAPNLMNDAQMADFEKKFGGLTSRMSSLWDQGIQAMMNGTLTWKNAMNAIYSELAAEFIQNMITAPMKKYVASMAPRLAVKLGLIKAETAAEVSGQAAQTTAVVAGEGVKTAATSTGVLTRLGIKLAGTLKSIMMSAWEAMAAAWAAMSAIPIIGPALGVAAGIAAFAGVSAIVGKVASARGGYDIPAGVNPMTQLHEEEMVLPKQHANTIRALGKSVMSDGSMAQQPAYAGDMGAMPQVNIQAWDSKDIKRFMKKHGRELAGGLKGYGRNFGK
ncbi:MULTISPECIES: phage tail protein [unclassified Acinetobacter]|uniref:phage tail protein n=1 Tax=unclassified Acinetobacter TaxID=196816 RepID=UPI0025777788|nr:MULTISPECIES: phage tail protein [unclassified Acinetobacter]MDM1765717.1 phage tail protein [Acinetobacter sp. 226-1]MDM1769396.1 phage tail protein [Acinetobacter sp. 226-4]